MRTSESGISLIKRFEGLRLNAYRDSTGIPTIGWGTTKGVKMGQAITKERAEELLRDDVERFEGYVHALVKVPLTQGQFDALVSFVYNLGPGNFESSTLLRVLNEGDYAGAAEQFNRWVMAGRQKLPGLVRRRAAESRLFSS